MKRFLMIIVCMTLAITGNLAVSVAYAEESGCFQSTDNWIIRVFSEGMASPHKIMLAVIDPVTGLRVPHSAIRAFAGATTACRNLDRATSHLCELESAAQSPDISLGCDAVAGTAYIIHDQAGEATISTIPDIVKATTSGATALQTTPAFLAFGKLPTGRKTISVTVTNSGAADVHITSVSMPAAPFRKTLDTCTGAVIAPATGSCSISITFAPVTAGSYTGSFNISSDGGNVTVQLTGSK
ncbi:MAG: hypothetical protein C0402_09135 [Thermodesulfovibrio sp.]|nr:hypothetical protein [Thermodesulfovibrio sp.]